MKHATLARLAALSLLGSATLALAQQPAQRPAAPPPESAASAAAKAAPAAPQGAQAPQAMQPPQAMQAPQAIQAPQAAPARPAGPRAERRRRSYASCNRASHQRGLHGGRRRRFLIRCRLGYERPRQPPAVQAAPQPPAPAGQPGARP